MAAKQSPTTPTSPLESLIREAAPRLVCDEERAQFGQFLVTARQQSGLTIEEIARKTKVAPRYLEALEQGRLEVLPGGVYRRSILRNYADEIGLDPGAALERLEKTFGTPLPSEPHNVAAPSAPREPARVPRFEMAVHAANTVTLGPRALEAATVILVVIITAHFVAQRSAREAPAPAAPSHEARPAAPSRPDGIEPAVRTISSAPVREASIAHASATSGQSADAEPAAEPVAADAQPDDEPGLMITSNPDGARVTVNGIAWGVTPLVIPRLPPGEKVIRATKDGYVAREQRILLAGKNAASVRLTLDPRN